MFGLPNQRGSCWVNAALQGLFSCPTLTDRYEEGTVDKANPYDVCLEAVYRNKGVHGLKEFYECIRTSYMPAGENIGDSHELIVHLCDKLPWLDEAFRFNIGDRIVCNNCQDAQMHTTTTIDLHLMPSRPGIPLLNAIQEYVQPQVIESWACEKCKEKKGCTKQVLFGTFPKVLMIWSTPIEYSSVIVVNNKKYYLFSVVCFTGGHWRTYARKMPPGSPWYVLDDQHVVAVDSRKFPLDSTMRVLLYFLHEN
uniref:ubiquitinyl hydrolase 1 n=1 Tax=viral metagenome TaxID=1070528 RepID=A0A6C0HKF8_9ZZZZ